MKKVLCGMLALTMVLAASTGYGAGYTEVDAVVLNTITASGTVGPVSTFDVSVVDKTTGAVATALTFTPNPDTMIGDAPQVLKVSFNDNNATARQVILYTDNRKNATCAYTADANGNKGPGSGLIGVTNKTIAAPLFWTVFDNLGTTKYVHGTTDTADDVTVAGATAYAWKTVASTGAIDASATAAQSYVLDKQQGDLAGSWKAAVVTDPTASNYFNPRSFNDATTDQYSKTSPKQTYGDEAVGAATVLYGITGKQANLANVPFNDDNAATGTTASPIVENRVVTDGEVFIRLACDFHGVPSQTYKTETLTAALITMN